MIVIGPLPPPVHGVTVSTSLVLENALLSERFRLEHLDTSDHRSGENLGRWDIVNLWLGTRQVVGFLSRARGEKGVVYLPLSQSTAGFLRDSLFIRLADSLGWKTAGHLRGGEFPRFYNGRSSSFQSWMRSTLMCMNSIAVMGACLRNQFEGIVATDRISVIPNGTPDIEPDGRRRSGVVLFLSNLRRRKGVLEAIEAARLVVRAEPRARFLFVGAWEDATLERDVRRLAAPHHDAIEFHPPVTGERKRELLLSSSILLFPPVEPEGHPRVVLEALSAGLPVVTTDRGAIAETVIDGESGFVLSDPDPAEIADRLLLLLRNEQVRAEMAAAARQRYLSSFTQPHADRLLADWLSALADSDNNIIRVTSDETASLQAT